MLFNESQFSTISKVVQACKADEFKLLLHLTLYDVVFHCSSASTLLTSFRTYLALIGTFSLISWLHIKHETHWTVTKNAEATKYYSLQISGNFWRIFNISDSPSPEITFTEKDDG